jgi:hypothetical protein
MAKAVQVKDSKPLNFLFLIILLMTTACLHAQTPSFYSGGSLDERLLAAAEHGDVTNVVLCLKQGANPNYIQPFPGNNVWAGFTPLYGAIFPAQSAACVKVLLEAGADPLRAYDKNPWIFALEAACQDGMTNRAILEMLLNSIKQLPSTNSEAMMDWVLYPLIKRNDMQVVWRLQQKGADLGVVTRGGKAAFVASAESGHYTNADKILDQFAVQYRQSTNKVAVMPAVERLTMDHYFDDDRLARVLLHARQLGIIFSDSTNSPNWTHAVAWRCPETAKALGCPPDELKKIVPWSAEEMMLFAGCNTDSQDLFTNLVKKCLSDVPDPKATASKYFCQLLQQNYPLLALQPPALKYLRSIGANPNFEYSYSPAAAITPLEAAISRRHPDIVQWLIHEGADVNHINSVTKATPLADAVGTGDEGMVQWLLAHGAKVQEAQTGRPLLVLAVRGKNPDVTIPLILRAGADPYMPDPTDGKSATDLLVERLDIRRLRELDKKNKFQDFLAKYTPPKNSPFIGIWWNEKNEFETFSLILNDEGMAIVGTSIMPMGPIPWRTLSTNTAVLEENVGGKPQGITLEWLPEKNAIQIVSPSGEQSDRLLKKQPGTPPKTDVWLQKKR